MKKVLTILCLLCVIGSAYAWKPLFAGHRGSYTGVMNTSEAYINGVTKYGYTGLECDVRTTKDGYYVISHDETTEKVGGSLTVANSMLEALLAEDYTQTRGGVTYTGHICTMDSFLQICQRYNAFPIIELKWATGINNNDMSRFPGLYQLIEKYDMVDKAIILTSMKKSLEYVRSNYPLLQCQYLCYTIDDAKLAWCKQWGINFSVQRGGVDIQWVKRCRNAGLEVAVWTINNREDYIKHGQMGCYMMTCDYLYPEEMPELSDIDWDSVILPEDTTTVVTIEVESLQLSTNHIDTYVGDTAYVDAIILPEDATDKSISALVDKYRMIAVTHEGTRIRIVPKKVCEAVLTVKAAGEHTATCSISVTAPTHTDEVNATTSEEDLFDIMGRRISNTEGGLGAGIYIIRQGNKTKKINI